MGDLNIAIDFSTNANAVKAQIAALNKEAENAAAKQYRLEAALRNNKATTKALVGERSLKKGILALDKEIGSLAQKRANAITAPYQKALGPQRAFVTGLVKQNEVMRIQTKIARDNATAMVNLGKNTQWAGRQLVVGFTVPLTIAAGAAMKAFSDLEKEMVRFKRVYGDVSTTGSELKKAADDVRNLAMEWTKYGVAVSDTIAVAADAAGAGFAGDKLISQVNAATKLAVLGELDKQAAMKTTIALQSTYRMSNEELGQSINYLNQLENQTMVTMQDMVTAIPKAGTVVEGLGGSVKDLGTFLAAMEEGGVTAAEAANALKSGLGSLLNPSVKAREQLAGIGVELDTLWAKSEKSGGGVMEVVTNLATALEQLGQTQKQQVIEEIFGKHQFARMNALLSNINSGTQAAQAQTVASASQLEAALISQKELGKFGESSLTKFQSSIERLKKSIAPIGEQVMKVATGFINFADKVISAFNALPDTFKNISLGIVGIGGIIGPLVVMLIGQVLNFVGTIKQAVITFKSWRKGLGWVEADSVSMVNIIQKMNNNLLQQNLILQQNAQLWGSIVRPTTMPIGGVGGGPSKPIRRNTGGSIPGSGNTDTVPALLTPGEYVVRKSVAQRFGPMLSAMNAGRLQGFRTGAPKGVKPEPELSSTERALLADQKVGSLTKKEAAAEKIRAHKDLMSFKTREGSYVKRMYSDVKKKHPLFEFAGISNWLQWDQSHIGKADSNKVINEEMNKKQKLWNYKGDLILDNHMINVNLPSNKDHPSSLSEVPPFKKYIDSKLKLPKVSPNHLVTDRLVAWRKRKGAGAEFYSKFMDDNFIFMNLVGGKKGKDNTKQVRPSGKYAVNPEAKGMATGGFVPGTGNSDTVPAMLTPGEAVIKKSAAQKYGHILQAMNEGRLQGFEDGVVPDPGPMGPDYGKAHGAAKLSVTDRQGLMKPFFDAISDIVKEMSNRFKLTVQEIEKLEYDLIAEYTRDDATGEASHAFRARDEHGNQFWSPDNLAFTPKMENNFMEQITKSTQNQKMLNASIERQAKATNLSTKEIDKRRAVVARVAAGEHMLEEAERKLLGEMLLETKQYQMRTSGAPQFSESIQNNLIPIGGTLTGVVPNAHSGEQWGPEQTTAARPHGRPMGGRGPGSGDAGSEFDPVKEKKDFTAVKMLAMNAMWMFSTQLDGVTEKMGGFGTVLSQALMMLPMLSMGGVPMGGGFKGLLGRGTPAEGAGRLKGAFGRYGLVAGGVGGAIGAGVGAIAGNAIGGTAGSAVQWGATGAGVGAMFGPMGIAVGATAGALGGLAYSLIQTKKANDEAKKAIANTNSAWKDITKELQEKFDLGSGTTLVDMISTAVGLNKEQTEMFVELKEQMMTDGTAWNARVEDLKNVFTTGNLGPGQITRELDNLALEMRGIGVDEQSITAIIKAFVDSLPVNMRQGENPANVEVRSTDEIVRSAAAMVASANNDLVKIFSSMEERENERTGFAESISNTAGTTPVTFDPRALKTMIEDNAKEIGVATEMLSAAMSSMTNEYINASKEEKKAIIKRIENARALSESISRSRFDSNGERTPQADQIEQAAYSAVNSLIDSENSNGLDTEEWKAVISDYKGNAIELGSAAAALIEAGHDLSGWSAEQIVQVHNLSYALAHFGQIAENQTKKAEEARAARETLEGFERDRIKAMKDAAIQIEYEKKSLPLAIVEAKLEVTQIKLEQRALAKFIGKFNSAFGQSIDSFADAQYQIDKIGARITRIQQDVIGPMQEKIDDMNRVNVLAQRKLDEIDEKREKRAERINKKYDKRAEKIEAQNKALDDYSKVLDQIKRQNDYIFDQQKNSVDMADALAKGDVAGAVNAMIESNRAVAGFSADSQDQQLQNERDRLAAESKANEEERNSKLENDPWKKQYEGITKAIERRNERILELEDKIYDINEKQIEPLQRKSELMSRMLSNSKRELENQKANAMGLDAENIARERALINAQKTVKEAEAERGIVAEINDQYKERAAALARQYNKDNTHYASLHKAIDDADTKHTQKAKEAAKAYEVVATELAKATRGLGSDIPADGTIADTIQDVLRYMEHGDFRKPTKPNSTQNKPATRPDNGHGTNNPSIGTVGQTRGGSKPGQTRGGRPQLYAGGTVPGKGGQDSVAATLTPGEFVMRKSAVDRIGEEKLRLLNQGQVDGYSKGGKVKPNFLGVFGEQALTELKDELPKDAVDAVDPKPSTPSTPSTDGTAGSAGSGKKIGKYWAVAPRSTIGSGLRYGSGKTHWEPWIGFGGTRQPHSGVLDVGGGNMPVRALSPGKVVKKTFGMGFGPNMIILDHGGGAQTRYAHLNTPSVGMGQQVKGGQFIAKTNPNAWSSTANSKTLPGHLHFAWKGIKGLSQPPSYGRSPWLANAGGLVPGVGNTDTVPAILTPGEFVLNKAAVSSMGQAPLRSLNDGALRSKSTFSPSAAPSSSVRDGDVVYNYDYNLSFTISEASDANEVANVVLNKINSATKSRVRSR